MWLHLESKVKIIPITSANWVKLSTKWFFFVRKISGTKKTIPHYSSRRTIFCDYILNYVITSWQWGVWFSNSLFILSFKKEFTIKDLGDLNCFMEIAVKKAIMSSYYLKGNIYWSFSRKQTGWVLKQYHLAWHISIFSIASLIYFP